MFKFGFVVDSHLQHQDLLLRFLQLLLGCVQRAVQAALRSRQAHAALLSLHLLPLNLAKDALVSVSPTHQLWQIKPVVSCFCS